MINEGIGKGRSIRSHAGSLQGHSKVSRRPDFFIVGASKSGTSSLYFYLTQHPDIFMPELKEPHFFYNRESPGSSVLEEKDLKKYLKLFEGVPESKRAGEASTSYLWLANAAQEIKQLQPEAKIIMILRNPVDRAYSEYWQQMRFGGERLRSFEEGLEVEPKRIRRGDWHGLYYVEGGCYAKQVSRYLDVFGHDSVRIYLLEDLSRDPLGICRDAFEFLGVDPDISVKAERIYNRGGVPKSLLFARLIRLPIREPIKKALPAAYRRRIVEWVKESNIKPVPEMDPKTRTRLKETFREDIMRLEKMIGRDLSHWRE